MKLTTFKPSRLAALLCVGAMGFAVQAHADLNIFPSSLPSILLYTSTDKPDASALNTTDVEGFIYAAGWGAFELGLAYKSEVDTTAEYGNGQDYYSTSYNPANDPSGAEISWDNPVAYIDCGDCFLVVKDGNQNPYAYIFDISDTWNGQDTINLSGFWPNQGAISYVAIYNNAFADGTDNPGGSITPVPEAETYAMMLAGLGLVGFAARRKRSKTA